MASAYDKEACLWVNMRIFNGVCGRVMLHFYLQTAQVIDSFQNTKMSGFYEQLCNLFIRPTRQTYSDYDLGSFVVGQVGNRQNFTFASLKGHELKATFFKHRNNEAKTCILYLHSFNGSRLECLRYVPELMDRGFHVCSFDFAGCGNSGGEYVTLGYNERWDVLKIITYVREKYGISQFFLWGRSMGAVSAIKFYSLLAKQQAERRHCEIKILGLVLDSAFISLKRLVVQVGRSRISIPQIIIKALFLMIGSSIQQRADFKVQELELEKDVETIRCSTMLIASKEDTFISFTHSEDIFSHLKLHENKQIEYIRGEHYENRDHKIVTTIYQFFESKLKNYIDLQLKVTALRHSHINKPSNAHIIHQQQLSLERNSKSLRKYEPKREIITEQKHEGYPPLHHHTQNREKKTQSSAKIILFRSNAEEKVINTNLSTQYKTLGSDKKIPVTMTNNFEKQYQTEKKMESNAPQIKIVISSGNKEVRHKNELRNKSKPNFVGKMIELYTKQKPEDVLIENNQIDRKLDYSDEKTQECQPRLENQENHCNIIGDKLRKKGKINREKVIEFKSLEKEDKDEPNNNEHINRIKFQPTAKKATNMFEFTLSVSPTNCIKLINDNKPKIDEQFAQINRDRSYKKLSMTAQQYKNNQIKMIKGVVNLSPSFKKRHDRQQMNGYTELKIKMEGNVSPVEIRMNDQCKSMSNLIANGQFERGDNRSTNRLPSYFNNLSLSHRQRKD